MRLIALLTLPLMVSVSSADEPLKKSRLIARPEAHPTLVNPACSHCRDEAKRRADLLKPDDPVLSWTRGYSEGGAIPIRFFLNPYRVISDSYGVFVFDPDAGYARGFEASYEFRFHGWRDGVMVMKHKDGTIYSCLSGVAFDGPNKGTRLKAVPTLTSTWGFWLKHYPNAVAYHMFDKYQPAELPTKEHPDALESRGKPDSRLEGNGQVLGVWTGRSARAYPVTALEQSGLLRDESDGETLALLWEPETRTAAAYRMVASQPRKYKAPQPDDTGVSPANAGVPIPAGTAVQPARKVTLTLSTTASSRRFIDAETQSTWDIAGRCVEGTLKGWTLEWVDSVQVKWFAWAAEYPQTTVYSSDKSAPPAKPKTADAKTADANKAIKEVAGTAEFLRLLPKPFATVQAVDAKNGRVTLLIDGEIEPKVWPVEPDAEIKVGGWWGRLEQFQPGDRVWAWLKLDRKKKPVGVIMLADEISEFDFHGSLRQNQKGPPKFSAAQIEARRSEQKAWLRKRWTDEGLPGTLTRYHVFSGEVELALDHEAMRWGRALKLGDVTHLQADPPIKAVVKMATPWRERTMVRLVVGELEAAELKLGQRLRLKMAPPTDAVEKSAYPPDIGQPRSKPERIDWFLASIYCTCGVSKDVCTGHFYTLASCNPNGCGMPRHMRNTIAKMIDQGRTDEQIFDEILSDSGPLLLRPHLMP